MDIPRYPDSRPLELSDQARLEAAFAALLPLISEFTFTNLYAWRAVYNFRVSLLNTFIVLASSRDGKRGFFCPIGAGDMRQTVTTLAEEKVPFIRIAENDKDTVVSSSGFHAELDKDNSDYIYVCRDLVELKGKRFDGKRNLIKKFKRHAAYEYVTLDGGGSNECLDFQDLWCVAKGCDGEKGLLEERDAARVMCHNFSRFNLCGGAIKVDGRVCAVAVGQRLNADTLVMHVLKAVPAVPGLYQTMHNEFLRHEAAGYTYLNMEQDLGIEGLRKSKLSYQPARLIDKYIVHPLSART